jgi:Holliday junction resolvasome RuvABC DNA-binding subunit
LFELVSVKTTAPEALVSAVRNTLASDIVKVPGVDGQEASLLALAVQERTSVPIPFVPIV